VKSGTDGRPRWTPAKLTAHAVVNGSSQADRGTWATTRSAPTGAGLSIFIVIDLRVARTARWSATAFAGFTRPATGDGRRLSYRPTTMDTRARRVRQHPRAMADLNGQDDMGNRTCSVEGCVKPPRSGSAEWCKMHYHRWYRHGSVDSCATGVPTGPGRLYRLLELPGHPLADSANKVWEHRVVLFATIGPGVHPCRWCGKSVSWDSTRGDTDCLVADHVNGRGDDNRPENLVPACVACNNTRGAQARHDALVAAGFWSNHDTIARTRVGRSPRIGG